MIANLETFAARGVAAQNAADAILAVVASLQVTAKPDIAMCKIISSEPVQCPLCERIVTGAHECRRNRKGGGK